MLLICLLSGTIFEDGSIYLPDYKTAIADVGEFVLANIHGRLLTRQFSLVLSGRFQRNQTDSSSNATIMTRLALQSYSDGDMNVHFEVQKENGRLKILEMGHDATDSWQRIPRDGVNISGDLYSLTMTSGPAAIRLSLVGNGLAASVQGMFLAKVSLSNDQSRSHLNYYAVCCGRRSEHSAVPELRNIVHAE